MKSLKKRGNRTKKGKKSSNKTEFVNPVPLSVRKWWRRTGSKWITLEHIAILVLFIVVMYLLYNHDTSTEYGFQGLNDKEIKRIKHIPVQGLKKTPAAGVPRVYKKENKCRAIIEGIYGKPFPSVRPDFLKSPATGKNLEIDCYNAELKIGLEYDGEQHAKYNPHFHRNGPTEFTYQIARDEWKTKKCREEGITLIRVPHWVTELDLEKYIRNKLREAGKL